MVQRELRDFLRSHERRTRQLPRAILIGLFSGLVAVAFRGTLNLIEPLRTRLIGSLLQDHSLWGPPLVVLSASAGAATALWLVSTFAPETAGSGIPQVKSVLHSLGPLRWLRVLTVKFTSGVVGIGSGLVLGREGPTIQMGAAVGEMVSRLFGSNARERRTLIAAGAGAGLSAAFNAPLAGLVFVLEEAQRDFAPAVFSMALLASAVGDVVTRLVLGQLPVFHVNVVDIPPLSSLPTAALIGVVAGLLGVAFNRGLVSGLDFFQKLAPRRPWLRGAVAGACVGLVGCVLPETIGSGSRLVESMLDGSLALAAVPLVFVLRFGLTMLSYGSGAAGGIFAPLLVLGAAIGLGIGGIAHQLGAGAAEQVTTFAAVGMAAYFSAIVRAPLTGIVLIVEMTGNYSLVLPLLVASLTAYGIADYAGDRPIYEALLERDLLRSQPSAALEKTLVLDFTILSNAPYEGRCIGELGLPEGCLIILVRRGGREEVPTPAFRLAARDQITAVVSPGAAHAVARLREGASV